MTAGIPLKRIRGSPTSVFVACDSQDYAIMLARDTENRPLHAGTGIAHAVISNRISFFFNLHGPSMTISTACSGSLAALNLACQSIRSGESPQALVGGVHLTLDPDSMSTESNLGYAATRVVTIDEMSSANHLADFYLSTAIATYLIRGLQVSEKEKVVHSSY